ncbi:unnamed protein product [Amaranthus hypochondriacus]
MTTYNYIEEITPLNESMVIKIRIIRLWKPPSYDDPSVDGSIEMVFLDAKGGKIQATVKKSLINRFNDKLIEGHLHTIAKFDVGQNNGNYRKTKHPYKINFFTTSVNLCKEELVIPMYGFDLVSFNDIQSRALDDNFLIDIIGQIVLCGPIETIERNGKTSKKVVFELNDHNDNTLKCTLWDKYAEEASNYVGDATDGFIVLIIQFAKIKEWRGELNLSNFLFSTRLFFDDQQIEKIQLLKNR